MYEQRRGMKIYTRGGDKGETSLFTGERRAKDDLVFEALGSSDELNAFVGQAKDACEKLSPELFVCLSFIQQNLLQIGSHLATPVHSSETNSQEQNKQKAEQKKKQEEENNEAEEKERKRIEEVQKKRTQFDHQLIPWLESNIDQMDQRLPPLRNFILPAGGASGAFHVARAVCRRFERDVIRLRNAGHALDPAVLQYVNRLSDFFFVSARYVDFLSGHQDSVFSSSRSQQSQYPRCQFNDTPSSLSS